MAIKFEENGDLAYELLVEMHEEGAYLDNMSTKHPLSKLYEWVNVEKYWNYLYNLCLET